MSRIHAFADDALGEHDAVGLVAELTARRVSIPEVVEAAVGRADRIDRELGGLAYRAFDRARAEAGRPRPGYFSGVPTFLKDNCDLAGIPTRRGTDAVDPPAARRNGDLARMVLGTGVIPLGKTQLSEFGFNATAEHPRLGAVRNPWNPGYTAGASSSGSAVMVASGAVPLAHANDGGGSIRIPAAATGLVGLKPTRDRFAQDALYRQMPLRIVQDGVLTRSVRDQAAYYREVEKVYRNVAFAPIGDVAGPGRRRLRVGMLTRGAGREVEPSVLEATAKTALLMEELGHRVEEIPMPVDEQFPEDFLLYWGLLAYIQVRTSRLHHGRRWHADLVDNLTRGLAARSGRRLQRVPGAVRRLRRTAQESACLYRDYDVVLSPTLAHPTPQIGHLDPTQPFDVVLERLLDWVAFTPWQNATGDPAISLPLASDQRGLPVGMMFSAPAGAERRLLELAYELEEASGWQRLQEL